MQKAERNALLFSVTFAKVSYLFENWRMLVLIIFMV